MLYVYIWGTYFLAHWVVSQGSLYGDFTKIPKVVGLRFPFSITRNIPLALIKTKTHLSCRILATYLPISTWMPIFSWLWKWSRMRMDGAIDKLGTGLTPELPFPTKMSFADTTGKFRKKLLNPRVYLFLEINCMDLSI